MFIREAITNVGWRQNSRELPITVAVEIKFHQLLPWRRKLKTVCCSQAAPQVGLLGHPPNGVTCRPVESDTRLPVPHLSEVPSAQLPLRQARNFVTSFLLRRQIKKSKKKKKE